MKQIKYNVLKGQEGFTLLEVLIALGIFSIGVLAVFAMQTNSMGRSGKAIKSNLAAFWAQDLSEDLLRLPYGDTKLDTVSTSTGGTLHQRTEGPYTIKWAVFSSSENGKKINDFSSIKDDPLFLRSNKMRNLANLQVNSKLVVVYVSHPLGQSARLIFTKPNL